MLERNRNPREKGRTHPPHNLNRDTDGVSPAPHWSQTRILLRLQGGQVNSVMLPTHSPTHSLWLQRAHTEHLTVWSDRGSKIVERNATENTRRTGVTAAFALSIVMNTYDLPANSADDISTGSADFRRAW
jgi:hypothetical protein